MEVTKYTVTAERGKRTWVLQCVEVPGAISEVTRLDQADQIKDAIAWVADVDEDSIEIEVIPQISADTREHMEAARRLRKESDEAKSRAAEESRVAAAELADAGLSLRDIGVVMDVSFQRAQQLVSEAGKSTEAPASRKTAARKRPQIAARFSQGSKTVQVKRAAATKTTRTNRTAAAIKRSAAAAKAKKPPRSTGRS